MRFFDREDKIDKLHTILEESARNAQFTVITGRRRVGKTELVKHAFPKDHFAYLFVSRKSEIDLVQGFVEEFNRVYPDAVSREVHTLEGFFREVFKLARSTPITLFVDEFQDFSRVNPAFFSTLQGLWDREHDSIRLNLLACGSINSLMRKIFLDNKEPLYGRQTATMRVDPFSTSTLKEILRSHKKSFTPDDLLALWAFTGGVAKYVALLMDAGATSLEKMVHEIVAEDSFFLEEGRVLLSDEFGKEHSVYFSILSAIARGATSRNEIEQCVGRQVGGHLTRLEENYHLISKTIPFRAQSTRQTRYRISDPFYRFWFRFIFKYDYMVQMKSFDLLQRIVLRDYPVFSGFALEEYFKAKFAESGKWSRIGAWWDRKGENEIDLIAENELDGHLVVAEVKHDARRLSMESLKSKFECLTRTVSGLPTPSFTGLSLADM
jgi:hypothetical protein